MAVGIMAVCNFVLAIYIFFFNKNNTEKKDVRQNHRSLLSILVLNYKMNEFYELFSEIQSQTNRFRTETINDTLKISINDNLENIFLKFRIQFAEPVGAVDEKLYKELMEALDHLQSDLSTSIFDKGVNLDVDDKYNELISEPTITAQSNIIRMLYRFV